MKWPLIAVFVIAAGLAGTITLNYYRSLTPVPAEDAGAVGAAEATANDALAEVKEFTVAGANYSFSPATMTVKKGDAVRVVFENSEGFHDFRIDEFSAATKQIRAGDHDAVEFTADKAGSFEYYCSVGAHRTLGMKGMLVVEE